MTDEIFERTRRRIEIVKAFSDERILSDAKSIGSLLEEDAGLKSEVEELVEVFSYDRNFCRDLGVDYLVIRQRDYDRFRVLAYSMVIGGRTEI